MPILSDFKAEMNESKYFSKIDLKQAYHQLELTEESCYITTFSTQEGLFCYKQLNYGTNSAAEIFQNILQHNLSDIQGVKNISYDIIHGKTRKLHNEALENCLQFHNFEISKFVFTKVIFCSNNRDLVFNSIFFHVILCAC